ncbi:HD-GYP domain-containing protein [Ferviditalea candida]|uniref:HD domain-containing phosphohydrolase n=1 Tax=Ferviditalea candida TaxID=3108399 RepID=A0ABU5ZC36_9BACL|nr:HD domain-containing phosphohydrolase [Paenibacillaceae bacterium T2]
MRLIHIEEYNESSMILGKPIYDAKKRILLAQGQRIHYKLLERLKLLGISYLFVEDYESKGITLEEMMDIPTWLDVITIVQDFFASVQSNKPLPFKDILLAAGKLIKEILSRPVVAPVPTSTIASELQLYAHSVNVAILCLQIGKSAGFSELQLRDLSVGALLHDIGKIAAKNSDRHAEAGFEILRKIREMNLVSAHMAFQHHETLDGQGFPRGIKGEAFHPYAQICSLANRYEHLISDDNCVQPHEALEILMTLSDKAFSIQYLQAFMKAIPLYLPGTKIRLSNGEQAIVTRIQENFQRPYIRYTTNLQEISLVDHPNIVIHEAIHETASV